MQTAYRCNRISTVGSISDNEELLVKVTFKKRKCALEEGLSAWSGKGIALNKLKEGTLKSKVEYHSAVPGTRNRLWIEERRRYLRCLCHLEAIFLCFESGWIFLHICSAHSELKPQLWCESRLCYKCLGSSREAPCLTAAVLAGECTWETQQTFLYLWACRQKVFLVISK